MLSSMLNILSITALVAAKSDGRAVAIVAGLLILLAGPLFYMLTYARYRNQGERHWHEKETPVAMTNLQVYDNFVEHKKRQGSKRIANANHDIVRGTFVQENKNDGFTKLISGLTTEVLGENIGKKIK